MNYKERHPRHNICNLNSSMKFKINQSGIMNNNDNNKQQDSEHIYKLPDFFVISKFFDTINVHIFLATKIDVLK